MILVITKNQVKDRDAYLELAKAFAADAKSDKGCLDMQLAIQENESNMVVFISKWETKSDWESHCQGNTFAKHIPAMGPYYVCGIDSFYQIIA